MVRELLSICCYLLIRPLLRYVPSLVPRRVRPSIRERLISSARYRSGPQPRASCSKDIADDARYPWESPAKYRLVGGLLCHPHGRPQRTQRSHVHRYVALLVIGLLSISDTAIDKYSQIYRILLPICNTVSQIPSLMEKPALRSYIEDEFGSEEGLVREILGDFFRHGFDGSGGDNFFDAGSCIDGRLTSAWNWCSLLEKKRFFPVFLLSGKSFPFSPSRCRVIDKSLTQGLLGSMENGRGVC